MFASAATKVRRVDYSPSDYKGGTRALNLEQHGVYWLICTEIYDTGGPIDRDQFLMGIRERRKAQRIIGELVAMGKLVVTDDGLIDQSRCEKELKLARNRIDSSTKNGGFGGRPPKENSDLKNRAVSALHTPGNQVPESNLDSYESKGDLGRCAPVAEDQQSPIAEPQASPEPREAEPQRVDELRVPSEEVAEFFERTLASLKGEIQKGIRDPIAYRAAIAENKFANFLRTLNDWAGETLDDDERWLAWDTIAVAQAAGSRSAMSKEQRRALDALAARHAMTLEKAA